jgi:lysophospholipase L1-like esterase
MYAQGTYDTSYHNWYYAQRMELYNSIPAEPHDIVFLGNSITERGDWQELIPGVKIANRGIGGDITFGVLARLDNVIALKPDKLFLLIGINDIGRFFPVELIVDNYRKIVERLRMDLPKTRIYVQSVLPLNESVLQYDYLKGHKERILQLNTEIGRLAREHNLVYVDLHEVFADGNGDLKTQYTSDGIHVNPAAYIDWVAFLKKKKYL